jgi:anti-anti-sigma factor
VDEIIAVVTQLSVSVSVEEDAEGPQTLIRLVGEADASTPELGETLRAEVAKKPRVLVVDASKLTFIDSAAIHQIVRAHRQLRADGGWLLLRNPGPEVKRILQITGLGLVIPVHPSLDEADT